MKEGAPLCKMNILKCVKFYLVEFVVVFPEVELVEDVEVVLLVVVIFVSSVVDTALVELVELPVELVLVPEVLSLVVAELVLVGVKFEVVVSLVVELVLSLVDVALVTTTILAFAAYPRILSHKSEVFGQFTKPFDIIGSTEIIPPS